MHIYRLTFAHTRNRDAELLMLICNTANTSAQRQSGETNLRHFMSASGLMARLRKAQTLRYCSMGGLLSSSGNELSAPVSVRYSV